MDQDGIIAQLAKSEAFGKVRDKKITEMDLKIEDIKGELHTLSKSVTILCDVKEEMRLLNERVRNIELKPVGHMETIIKTLISLVVGGFFGFFIDKIINK